MEYAYISLETRISKDRDKGLSQIIFQWQYQ